MNKNLDILKNINILYLEDDENLLKHTSDILEDFVANIYGVKNTIDAMKILLEKKVDVIISDILLENENGINFLKYIKINKKFMIKRDWKEYYSIEETSDILDEKIKNGNYF